MDLPIIYGDDQWMLHEEQGHARVTKTKEAFEAAAAEGVAARQGARQVRRREADGALVGTRHPLAAS